MLQAEFLYKDMLAAFNLAQHEILIAGWMLSPELLLDRDHSRPNSPEANRLETVLGAAVRRGVRVRVLLYRSVQFVVRPTTLFFFFFCKEADVVYAYGTH